MLPLRGSAGFHAKRLSRDTFNLHLVSTRITGPLEQFIFPSAVKLSTPAATTVNTTNARQRFVSFLQGRAKGTRLSSSLPYVRFFSMVFLPKTRNTSGLIHVQGPFSSPQPKTKLLSQTLIIKWEIYSLYMRSSDLCRRVDLSW